MTTDWKKLVVSPEEVVQRIKPGMNIFLGSGAAEPRTLMKCLIESDHRNTMDLELIQLTRHGDILSLKELSYQNYRLKTFVSGWVADEAVASKNIDLIPGRYSQMLRIIKSKRIPIDAAFIQITPPNESGYCSLGVAVDVAREVMEQASLVVGEINNKIPFTYGDTIVALSDFDLLVESTEEPAYFRRWPVEKTMDQVAANIATVIEDGACLGFNAITLIDAVCPHLVRKRHLGIHTPYFTDALMELVKSGAVTNYRKEVFRGKSLASYALGTAELMSWLHHNPLVDFQSIDKVCSPTHIGANSNYIGIFHARKVDLYGRIAFPVGKRSITAGPGESADLFTGAELSSGGSTVFGLPSRNARGKPNIVIMLQDLRNQFHKRESIDVVVTEYGVANLKWRSIRERAQALIDIAHPVDRAKLVEQAKEKGILFPDQIFISESAHLYPAHIATEKIFKGGTIVRFRAIKPSDEEAMRRLFYRFSDKTIFTRFFYPIKTMPHDKMQEYVNIDYSRELSIVGLVGEPEQGTIIAEARFMKEELSPFADIAFLVDEKYQGIGIASFLYDMLIRLAKERGLKGFKAEVMQDNKGMIEVFEKGGQTVNSRLQDGVYWLSIPFKSETASKKRKKRKH